MKSIRNSSRDVRRRFFSLVFAGVMSGVFAGAAHGLPFYLGPGDLTTAAYPLFRGPTATVINNAGTAAGATSRYANSTQYTFQGVRYGPGVPTQILDASTYGGSNATSFYNFALGMNSAGMVLTSSQTTTSSIPARAARYAPGSATPQVLLPLPNLGDGGGTPESHGQAMNESGLVVGSSTYYFTNNNIGPVAVVWQPGQTAATKLHELSIGTGGKQNSEALTVTDAGMIGGDATVYKSTGTFGVYNDVGRRPARWASTTATPIQLDVLNTTPGTYGVGQGAVMNLNESGVAVGQSHRYSGTIDLGQRAVRWNADSTAAVELLSPAGLPAYYKTSIATKVNDAGVVIGRTEDPDGISTGDPAQRGIRWAPGSSAGVELRAFGYTAAGRTYTLVQDINSAGNVVGSSSVGGASAIVRAAIWFANTDQPKDINDYFDASTGWYALTAGAISDTGFVSGVASHLVPGSTTQSYTRSYTILIPQAGTYGLGDATLDGTVNFQDLVALAQHYNQPNASLSWNVADFDLNGVTNFQDLVTLAQHYNSGGPSLAGAASFGSGFIGDWAIAQSLVPEPHALTIIAGTSFIRRRRRRTLS